jgi:hypothetical protein
MGFDPIKSTHKIGSITPSSYYYDIPFNLLLLLLFLLQVATANFRDDFLTKCKLDSVGIFWVGSYGPNTSACQKSEPSNARILRYKRNGWK